MTYIHYENYKGGVNNLCVARDSETGLVATSTKGKERAILNLDHKITLYRKETSLKCSLSTTETKKAK